MTPIRIAVIGCGHLGRIHARILSTLPEFKLDAVCDPVESLREETATRHSARPVADYRSLAGQVDAAVVATPTRFHYDVACDLLEAGMHLLVEKPLTPTRTEADDLVRRAQRAGRVLQVGHVERFNPAWSALTPHLDTPQYIEGTRRGSFTFRSTDVGVVHDLMIHDIDLVLSIVRSPLRRVDALGIALFGKHEDMAQARFEFENGCVANLTASRASHAAVRAMHVCCRRAYAGVDFATRNAWVVRPSETLLNRQFDADTLSADERARLKDNLMAEHLPLEMLPVEPADAITGELVDFAESIRLERAPRVDGAQAAEALAVAERVLESIAQHQWDGQAEGPRGPLAVPQPSIIQPPHWLRPGVPHGAAYREAG